VLNAFLSLYKPLCLAECAVLDDGAVSLRELQELRVAGEVLSGKGCGAAEGATREKDAERTAQDIAGKHHHRARHLFAPVPIHSDGGSVWVAENRLRFPQIPYAQQEQTHLSQLSSA